MFNRLFKVSCGLVALSFLSAGLWAQAPKAPAVKDQGEYDIYNASSKETDPAKKLDLMKQWEDKYPDSDFKGPRRLMQCGAYQQIAMAAYGKTDAAVVDAGNKAAKTLIDGLDTCFTAETKPAAADDAAWAAAKKTTELQASTVYAYTSMIKKDYANAEPALKKVLVLDPNMAQASYWLGTVILATRKVERMPEAMYHLAHAEAVTGTEALPTAAAEKKKREDYLAKVYAGYHGDAKGLDEVKKAAAGSPVMPAEFAIKSIVDVQKEQEADKDKFAKEHPDLAFWNTIKDAVVAEGGDKYFADIKGSGIPPVDSAGFKMFPAKVVQMSDNKKELLVAVENPAGDATLQFDDPLNGTIETGTAIKFKGVLDAFTKEPYMLTFTGLVKEDVEGLPDAVFAAAPTPKKPAATKKAAPKGPAAAAPKAAAPAAGKK